MRNIIVSEIAREVLYQTLKEGGIPLEKGLRLEEFQGSLILTTDIPTRDDRIIKQDRSVLVIINKALEKKIGRATIDISSNKGKYRLVIIKDERVDGASKVNRDLEIRKEVGHGHNRNNRLQDPQNLSRAQDIYKKQARQAQGTGPELR